MNTQLHWFWFLMICAVVLWYSSVTLWVAIRGMRDIREMVKRLDEDREESDK